MLSETMLFKYLPFIIHFVAILLSILAGILVYQGLSTKEERIQTRIRLRYSLAKNTAKVIEDSKKSKAEEWFKKAQYPLGLNGLKYNIIYWSVLTFLTVYYVILPFIFQGPSRSHVISLVIIVLVGLVTSTFFPFSLFNYFMKKVIEYQLAKKHAEVFMLYDLVINEIEMMTKNRINTYNMLRNIKPYFSVLDKSLTQLLSTWASDEGPKVGLARFAEELNSKEAEALISVIGNLDNIDRITALEQLRGMSSMFVRSQIENYRRKRKITTDLLGIPIKATHFLIILNFMVVIVFMVMAILNSTQL